MPYCHPLYAIKQNNMKYIKKHLSTIIISLVIGVFLFYVQPILDFAGKKVVDFFVFTSDSFSNMYYEDVAMNDPHAFDGFNNYLLSIGMVMFFLWVLKDLFEKRKQIERKAESSLNKIKSLKEQLEQKNKDINEDKIQEDLAELEESAEKLKLTISSKGNRFLSLIIPIAFMTILLFSNYALKKSITKENVVFRNKCTILLPIAGEEKVNQLKSDWVQIKCQDDYNKIIKKIEDLENNNK
jgi:ABC-type multidrug transport system fused ATPase/permease subunit